MIQDVTFTVRLSPNRKRWLAPDGNTTTEEAEAARFTLRASLTRRDEIVVTRRCHDLAGGLAAWCDIETAIMQQRRKLRTKYEEEGEIKPPHEGADEAVVTAYEVALGKASIADESSEAAQCRSLEELLSGINFIARWPLRVVDVPKGWEDLAERSVPDPVFWAIQGAMFEAMVEVVTGKTQPSEP